MTTELDQEWLSRHPLPDPNAADDKNARGRVLIAGGSRTVPGGIVLTAEAALRAGAGKVRLATIGEAAVHIGVRIPEAAVIALPQGEDGEIAIEGGLVIRDKACSCDALVLGPAMSESDDLPFLVEKVLGPADGMPTTVLDAGALTAARDLAPAIERHEGRVIMTPHPGEMARLTGAAMDEVTANPVRFATEAAALYGAVVLLKGKESHLAHPDGRLLHFRGGSVGLATAGSGDVLAGIIGGLAARGACPFEAAAWGCWLHAEAGRLLAERVGSIGFLARELLPVIPEALEAA